MSSSMSSWFSRLPLTRKLTLFGMTTSALALVAAGSALLVYDFIDARSRVARDVGVLADVIGSDAAAPLQFNDPKAAYEALSALSANPHVVSAAILEPDGHVLARIDRDKTVPGPAIVDPGAGARGDVAVFVGSELHVSHVVAYERDVVGRVYVATDLGELRSRRITYISLLSGVLAGTLGLSLILAIRLQRGISAPLLRLTSIARDVTTHHRYDLRAEDAGGEVGDLVQAFNRMLTDLQIRARELKEHREALEATVQTRTAELRLLNRDLTVEHDRAMAASRAKGEFLANMSHEIRTPMNGIIGMTELALDTSLTSEQREYLETVKTSAEALLEILNDVLDFSKIESGRIELERVTFSLRDSVNQAMKPFTIAAAQKDLDLIVDIGVDVPDLVVGDPVRWRQIVTNLVGNAVKFTQAGHVVVGVTEANRDEHVSYLRVRVTDTGIGIPADKHHTIFEAFSQADGSTTRRFGGTGLGLSISARLVALMGGTIGVESSPGKGSTFHVDVPFERGVAPVAERPVTLPSARLLVVDDNAINRRIFVEQLARWGARVEASDSGAAAIELLEAAADVDPFALVLLDMHMPGMDGLGVAEHLRSHSTLSRVPIVMLTSAGSHGEMDLCRTHGISVCLTKPVRGKDLFAAVSPLLNGDAPVPASPAASSRQTPTPVLAGTPKHVLVAEDNPVNQRLAVGLLSKRGHHVTVANTGLEVLQLVEHQVFDLVLMDLQMPIMGGIEATEKIRATESRRGTTRVRIVAMTAHATVEDRDRCYAAGMDGYLTKPIDRIRLYEAVEEVLVQARATQAASLEAFSRTEALSRLEGDEDLLRELIVLFLDDSPRLVAEMHRAIERQEADRLRLLAHRLKGAASNLAAPGVADAARTLEQLAEAGRMADAPTAWAALSDAFDRLSALLGRLASEGS